MPNGAVGPYAATNTSTGDITATLLVLNHARPPGRYYHLDQLGSVRARTNEYADVTGARTYDPYGRPTTSAAGGASSGGLTVGAGGTNTTINANTAPPRSDFGYAGEYTDAETGFVYLRARYYDPATAQFLSRDPIEAVTRSAYGYVGGNPLNGVDPTGLVGQGPACPDRPGMPCSGSGQPGPIFGGHWQAGLCVGGSVGFVWGASASACVFVVGCI